MTKVIHGKINGRTIELSEDLGLAPGEEVEVQVKTLQTTQNWGEGLEVRPRGLAGLFGKYRDDPTLREICEAAYQERDADVRK